MKNLFNLTGFLTKRDAWAGNFEELLLDTPRTDAPMHLPSPPPPTGNWTPPPTFTFTSDNDAAALGATAPSKEEGPTAQHCALSTGLCLGVDAMTAKQRRRVEMLSILTSTPQPDVTSMSNLEAQLFIRARWGEFMAAQKGKQSEL